MPKPTPATELRDDELTERYRAEFVLDFGREPSPNQLENYIRRRQTGAEHPR